MFTDFMLCVCSVIEIKASREKLRNTAPILFIHVLLQKNRATLQIAYHGRICHGRRWRVILVDQRCHGASTAVPGLHPPHNMEAAAADIARLINHRLGGQAPAALIGTFLPPGLSCQKYHSTHLHKALPSGSVPLV